MDTTVFLEYGALGLLLAVLVGGYLLLVRVLHQFSETSSERTVASNAQLAFIQKIAEQSLANQTLHTQAWEAMTAKTLDVITGYTVALGKLMGDLETEAKLIHSEHADIKAQIAELKNET